MADPQAPLPPELSDLERAVESLATRGVLHVPAYPAVAVRVQEALGRKDVGLGEVAQLVGADAVIAAAILRCANSVMYRRGSPVTDLLQAITRIGANEVMRLLLASGLSVGAQAVGPLVPLRRHLWIQGLASAAVAQELARLRGLKTEEAFVLGLLHDFGKVVAAAALEAIIEERRLEARWPLEAWERVVERLHVRVGLAMAERWRLPPLVGEVIAAHHEPRGRCRDAKLLDVVRTTDPIVGLLLAGPQVTAAELARVGGLAASERAAVEVELAKVPEFVAAFETPAAAVFVGSPHVAIPEPAPDRGRPARIGMSIQVARRTRMFSITEILPDGLALLGEEPVPENRLLEAKVYAKEPFAMWVVTRNCRHAADGFRAEVQPFALSGPAREGWEKLVQG